MEGEKKRELENKIPEVYRKARVVGGIGGVVGAGIGGYVSFLEGNYLYAGLGAGIGIILGLLVGMLVMRRVPLPSLVPVETKTNLVLAVLSFLMALAGVVGFLRTGEMIGAIGAAFFALCGIYLVIKYSRGTQV